MKFKIVGWANMILGGFGAVWQLVMVLVVLPRMRGLYEGMEVNLPEASQLMPLVSLVAAGVMLGIFGLGVKLAFGKNPTHGWFVTGLVIMCLMIGLGGMYAGTSILSMVGPIYDLTGQM